MRIREGDPLEIYTNAGGEVIFKKYSPIGELSAFATQYAEALGTATKLPIVICDRDHCIAAAGISKKETLERRITSDLENIISERKNISDSTGDTVTALEGIERRISVASPIIASGDVCGAVVFLESENGEKASESDIKLATVASAFLGRQIEA